MGIITELKIQKNNRKRVSVFVDGEFVTGLESIIVAAKGLKVGDEIDSETLIEISKNSLLAEAFDKALQYISKGLRTEYEIRVYLQKKDYPQFVIEGVVNKLFEYKYLNDEAYLKSYLNCYSQTRGINRIKHDLAAKGLKGEFVDGFLSELDGQDEAALCAAEKYVRLHKNFDRAKLGRYLYSKGFDYSSIDYALKQMGSEAEND